MKGSFVKQFFRWGGFLALLVMSAFGVAQTNPQSSAPSSAAPMPSDPMGLMKLARRTNGIPAGESQPWHLKTTYEVFTSEGKKAEEGVYEVFWAGSRKYRQSYASKSFSQVDYTTDKGVFRTGDPQWPLGPERLIVRNLFHPLPGDETLQKVTLQANDRNTGGVPLHCVTVSFGSPEVLFAEVVTPAFCFDSDRPLLRYESGWGPSYSDVAASTLMNGILAFHNRFVARDISIALFEKPYVKIHIDALEDIAEVKDADYQPPASAVPAPPYLPMVSGSVMSGRVVKRVDPGFASLANPTAMDGRVIVDVIVGSDGHVKRIRPLTGSSLYQGLVSDAVYKWVYNPYTVAKVPTEVETEVAMQFTRRK